MALRYFDLHPSDEVCQLSAKGRWFSDKILLKVTLNPNKTSKQTNEICLNITIMDKPKGFNENCGLNSVTQIPKKNNKNCAIKSCSNNQGLKR